MAVVSFIFVLIVFASILYIACGVFSAKAAVSSAQVDDRESERRRILDELAELEEEYRAGKISGQDYEHLRALYKRDLAEYIK